MPIRGRREHKQNKPWVTEDTCARAHTSKSQAYYTHTHTNSQHEPHRCMHKSHLWIQTLSPQCARVMVPTTDHLPKELLRSI